MLRAGAPWRWCEEPHSSPEECAGGTESSDLSLDLQEALFSWKPLALRPAPPPRRDTVQVVTTRSPLCPHPCLPSLASLSWAVSPVSLRTSAEQMGAVRIYSVNTSVD